MRCFILCLVVIGMAACSTHNERWYLAHPEALQNALDACPQTSPQGLSCEDIKALDIAINQYALTLQRNPQAFGQNIIAMQNDISALHLQLDSATSVEEKTQLNSKINTLKNTLKIYLITVRLFESPEG